MRDLACARCFGREGTTHAGAPAWVATTAMGAAMLFAPDSVCRSGVAALPALVAHTAAMLAAIPLSAAPAPRDASRAIGPERRAALAWTLALAAMCLAAIVITPSGPRLPGETLALQAALLAAWLGTVVAFPAAPPAGAPEGRRPSLSAMSATHAPCLAAVVAALGAALR